MSSTSTPAPPGTPLESRNYVHKPRPFKNPAYFKNVNRRTRTLKQILAAEREFAMGGEPSAKKGKGKKMLTGAAAVAARRREEQLANESGTATPAETEVGEASMAMTDQDGDATIASLSGTNGTQTPAVQDAEAEVAMRRKRALPTYSSIEAPPSLRPRKKFCDITGLLAPYTDPKTGLRYHSVEIYEIIKTFGPGVDQSYLSLRGESSQIK